MADAGREKAADWDQQWREEPFDVEAPRREELTPRWCAQERLVLERFGSFDGRRVVEIGSGRAINALLYGMRGANVTLVDQSAFVLAQARELFDRYGVPVETVEADVFALPESLLGAFDVSMSFGLCEHFLDERRVEVVRAHLRPLRAGGVAMLGVPNRWSPVYRLWIGVLMARGSWPLGTEVPFSVGELRRLAIAAGGVPLRPEFGSFAASVVGHGLNQALYKLGHPGIAIPQTRLPVLDRLAYELLLPVAKPA
jgi:hypothetical protein